MYYIMNNGKGPLIQSPLKPNLQHITDKRLNFQPKLVIRGHGFLPSGSSGCFAHLLSQQLLMLIA